MISTNRLAYAAAIVLGASLAAEPQDGRVIDQKPLLVDAALRKEIESRAEFTTAFASARDVLAMIGQIEMREMTYLSDGLRVKGFVVAPRKPGRYPVLIWNRGGCRESEAMTPYFVARWVAPLASWGYVVVASQYRGTGGSEGKDEFAGSDVNDIINLFPLLETIPKADASRIGMAGFSRGALMTYRALTRTDRIKAAVVAGAPAHVDFRLDASRRKELDLPGHDLEDLCFRQVFSDYENNRQQIVDERSPIKWPEKLHRKTPILMLHGTSDWSALAEGSLEMAAALLKLKHPFRLVMLEGGQHDLVNYDEEVNQAMKAWFDRYVRDGRSWPSLEPEAK